MPQTHGYSGKPLWQKLGIKQGMRLLTINPPDHYAGLIEGADEFITVSEPPADMVHVFCPDRASLERDILTALNGVSPGGMLWVSWPKKASKLFRDLTEDQLREVILPTGWVDVKVCAVDADWSGLKFLRRKT